MRKNLPANIQIRTMSEGDLDFAAECTAVEGWQSENRTALEGFFRYDPHGCFTAESDHQTVGICIATKYKKSGFIGELIVSPEWRGKGIGAALLNHGVAYLHSRGVETVYLDGVVRAVGLYERNGFRKICRSWRFSGSLDGKRAPNVRGMVANDLPQVFALDQEAFGEDRSFFLRRRLENYPELSYVLVDDHRVSGYILGRGGEGWISAGPWVVRDEVDEPSALLRAFSQQAGERQISVGILECNNKACELVRSLGFSEHSDSPWRMALGSRSDLGTSPRCLAIGSAAKG